MAGGLAGAAVSVAARAQVEIPRVKVEADPELRCDHDQDGTNESSYVCDTDGDGIKDACFACDTDGDGALDACVNPATQKCCGGQVIDLATHGCCSVEVRSDLNQDGKLDYDEVEVVERPYNKATECCCSGGKVIIHAPCPP